MTRFTYEDHPNYCVKHPKLLYIDRYGNIYPDCKTYKTPPICHITDQDAVTQIKQAVFQQRNELFNMITVEVSSVCQAKCVYCFQRDAHRSASYPYYDLLLPLLEQLDTYWLFFSGGEILIQDDAKAFMRQYREMRPDTWIHLKTNGNAETSEASFVSAVCNSVMVSFNGFFDNSYRTIMGLDVEKTKAFCAAVQSEGQANLGLKLLNSPITIAETPSFLSWALSLSPKCIALQTAYNYDVEPSGKSIRLNSTLPPLGHSLYWDDIYCRIAEGCVKVLCSHFSEINQGKNYLTADKEFLDLFAMEPLLKTFFRTDGVYVIE